MADEKDKVTAEENAGQSEHDELVGRIAARFAELVSKGEQVMASLDAKAEAMDASFSKKATERSARVEDFAADIQSRVEKASEQFARDLDVILGAATVSGDQDQTAEDPTAPYEPKFSASAQDFREKMGVDQDSALVSFDPEFVERFANFAFDDVRKDVFMPERTRFMCWLATLLGCQGIDEYRVLLPGALNMGLEPEAVKEIVYQATAYLGIGRVYPFLVATNEVLEEAGVELPLRRQATTLPTEASRYEGGEKAQIACFGSQMAGYKDRGNPDYPHIAQWLVKNCFGDWYTRGGLTIAEREMITFCFIAAQGGCEAQLRAHAAANIQCGNSREFLIKVVSNNVPFIGYPRSLNAMAILDELKAE